MTASNNLTQRQQAMVALWDEHLRHEFETYSTEDTLETMADDAYVNEVPLVIGGVGKEALSQFYSKYFIPEIPPDTEMIPVSRTVGVDRIADEMVVRFTHSRPMNWILPGVGPTGKRVEMALVVIVQFRGGKIAHEHVYWDQASVLAQVGLLDTDRLPAVGAEAARQSSIQTCHRTSCWSA